MSAPLRIAIDARGMRGHDGGIETVIQGLCFGLAALPDGDERYLLYTGDDLHPLPRPYDHATVASTVLQGNTSIKSRLARRAPRARDGYLHLKSIMRSQPRDVRASNGALEQAGVDVVHFTRQDAFLTDIPSIYHPHDLQHRHMPENFDATSIARRERQYSAYCEQAALVAVASSWTRDDVIEQLALAPNKVRVVPWAAILPAYPELSPEQVAALAARLDLPTNFVLYPAQTWPHKNHEVLVRAVAELRGQGLDVPLVFPGRAMDHARVVMQRAMDLGVDDLVRFVGFVSDDELRGLYSLAWAVAVPSAFEAASFPLFEAFDAGVPCVTSDATSLPDQVLDGALIVPVNDARALAKALKRLWLDEELREQLTGRASARSQQFTWAATARHFRALYREAGGRLTDEDRELLARPALM